MTKQYGLHKCLQFGLAGLLGWLIVSIFTAKAQAQQSNIVPDNTLGAESSQVIGNFLGLPIEVITGGATRQINLFHSFQEFNISEGRGAYFFSPSADIQNILARVTGGNRSEILGTLGTFGNSQPNLFLINPNGIIFGEKASLNVQGSFVATTANGVQFGNAGNFSATNPQVPALLTVNPSALFFNQINQNAAITNQSQAPAGVDLVGRDVTGLRVPDSKSLLLVGGNVNLDGGGLTANGGRVELAGLTAPGNVGLNVAANALTLSVPNDLQLADISFSNQAFVSVIGAEGGDIAINVRNFEISNSFLFAGIDTGLGDGSTKGGDININADSISLLNNAQIANSTDGKGDAGNVFITARDAISLDSASIGSNVGSIDAVGNAGKIDITTGSLSVMNGAQINSFTRGRGNAGNITIQARDTVTFDGVGSNGFVSASSSSVISGAVGNGGNINVTAGSLFLTNGGVLAVVVNGAYGTLEGGQGRGGNVNINVRDALTVSGAKTGIFGILDAGAIGRAGDINVEAANVFFRNGGGIVTSTFGRGDSGNIFITAHDAISLDSTFIASNVESIDAVGNAGKINITTGSLSLTNGAQINSSTRGRGNAGNITIQARDTVTFDGVGSDASASGSFSRVEAGAVGNGGNINVTAGLLSLTNGGQLGVLVNEASGTLEGGQGRGGNVNINVRDALTISSAESSAYSGIFGTLSAGAIGRAGDIKVEAENVFVKDGGTIISSTLGRGDAGNISITARDAISLDQRGIYSNVESIDAVGNAGDIDITTGSLFVTNDAQINSFTRGRGSAGDITIQAKDAVTFDGVGSNGFGTGSFSSVDAGAVGNGGNINVTAGSLSLTNGGQLGVSVNEASGTLKGGQGRGGNINISVRDALTISGAGTGISGFLGAGAIGRAGDIKVEAENVFFRNGGGIVTSTFGRGDSGSIFITAHDAISLDSASIGSNVQSINAVGNAGKIDITTGSLSVTNDGQINSFTRGRGNAGNITIQAKDAVTFDGVGSNGFGTGSFSSVDAGAVGNGGNINVTAGSLSLTNGGQLGVSVNEASGTLKGGQGRGGNINISVRDALTISGAYSGIFGTLGAGAIGRAGDINVEAANVFIGNGGIISSNSDGKGTAGDINIISDVARLNNGQITAKTASTDGGNINFNLSQYLLLRNGSQISTTAGTAQAGGDGGNINIDSRFIVAVPEENSDIAANAFTGTGGNVKINSQGVFGIESRAKPTEKSDITASSELGVSGVININAPDTSSILNSFTELSPAIDTNALIANSCISRGTKRQENSFTITGSGALTTNRPGVLVSNYTTGEVRGVETTSRPWKKGDPIIEPTGLYRLNNGQLLLSRECSN
ncbi:S-layer family protein [Nostoc sp. FACHB-133]|uniref:beta strand repeat-containing protein n=1 Tax=Nostoc sp. FACHB-133 TaxID=2692835 RepID=UPI0016835B08|nr:S-layer family protein [Nostoc sp. FACHB-133]MBD2527678.1 S-layer family protein [Nostoc sp. FACHB-133]